MWKKRQCHFRYKSTISVTMHGVTKARGPAIEGGRAIEYSSSISLQKKDQTGCKKYLTPKTNKVMFADVKYF
jgi:hypothetical protein